MPLRSAALREVVCGNAEIGPQAIDNVRLLEKEGIIRRHQRQLAAQVGNVIREPERHAHPSVPQLRDRLRQQPGV